MSKRESEREPEKEQEKVGLRARESDTERL